ncbi:hypothetical protein JCM33374_g873 [Metschnikowia sp. JCM 33374]|nr:hypothetical protein JCM33374_g873 [Metschnikowia sp. JCM 33374]
MDLLKPGLPKTVLRQARSTNTISFRLLEQIQQLHEKTNVFLATSGTNPEMPQNGGCAETVADIFTDFYYHLNISNVKVTSVPEISLQSLRVYQQRVAKAPPVSDFEHALVSLIDEYSVIVALHHLANSILYKTIIAKAHVSYWSNIKSSSWSKTIYGIQTAPERAYHMACFGVRYGFRAGYNSAVAISDDTTNKTSAERVFGPLWASLRNTCHIIWQKSWQNLNVNFILKQSRLSMLKIPLNFLDDEIKCKLSTLAAHLDSHYQILGVFLNNVPVSTNTLAQILPDMAADVGTNVSKQLEVIERFIAEENTPPSTTPPNALVRYWPLLLLTVNYAPSFTINLWQNRAAIAEWIKLNFVDTAVGFWRNWIIRPIGDMLSILRNDETMTIASKESLKSDLDSLERMVADYLADTNVNVDVADIRAAVKQGDLTMVMSQYEDELRTPYKSILRGSLIRSILIQVQKTKVDGDLAINGIDKLLKSQQLLFGVLSISPSLFILYQANRALRRDASLTQTILDRRIDCLRSMNHINKLVSREVPEDKFISDGKLFVEVVNLNLLSQKIIPKALRGEFLQDLNQLALASSGDSSEVKTAVNRIWNIPAEKWSKEEGYQERRSIGKKNQTRRTEGEESKEKNQTRRPNEKNQRRRIKGEESKEKNQRRRTKGNKTHRKDPQRKDPQRKDPQRKDTTANKEYLVLDACCGIST